MPVLLDRKLEKVAQELAKFKTPAEASQAAGYKSGTSFASNARKRACRSDVKARVIELQTVSGVIAAGDSAYIQRKLVAISEVPLDSQSVRPSDQISALALLAKIVGALAPEKHDFTLSDLGTRLDAARRRAIASS